MQARTLRNLVATVEAWGDAFTPACACGCGEPVRLHQARGPQKYVNRRHSEWDMKRSPGNRNPKGTVPIEKFDKAVRKIARDNGWSLNETIRRGGWSLGRWHGMTNGHTRYLREETVRAFLRRVAGMAEEPTPWMLRQMEGERKSGVRAMNEIRNSHLRDRKNRKKGDVKGGG